MNLKRVVVTGLGALTPIGNSITEYWAGLCGGVSGANLITRFDATHFKTKFACEVKNFDPLKYLEKKEARKIDAYAQYAIAAAAEAMEHSGLDLDTLNHDRAGVIWGAGIGGLDTFIEQISEFALGDGTPRFSPFFIPKMIADIAGGHISIKYGFRGPNFTTVSACASSTNSIIDAYNYLRLGYADVMITGGSEATINQAGMGGFNAMKAMSERNDDFLTASRPFDLDRDGFVLGEGAGCLILETLEHAQARGATIYAEMVGCGMTADAYHITAPHPEGIGAANVMRNALQDANLQPTDIDYVNVHGTSTPLGDVAELKAINAVFGAHAYSLNVSSTKSMTGHLLGAAGAVEAIACILSILHQTIPPTINHHTPDPDIDPKINLTLHTPQKRRVRAALSNTFGFGGHNASVIFKEFLA